MAFDPEVDNTDLPGLLDMEDSNSNSSKGEDEPEPVFYTAPDV